MAVRAGPPRLKVLLVAEEIPLRADTGAFVYLRHFIDYCASRDLDIHFLATGHRFDRLVIRAGALFPQARLRLLGPALRTLGSWSLVIDMRSWRHTLFAWGLRHGPGWLKRALLALRREVQRHDAIIGRWLSEREARGLRSAVRRIDPDIVIVNTIFATSILEAKPPRARAAVITHDVLHERTRAFAARGLSIRPAVSEALEAELLDRFDVLIAISPEDAATLRRLAPRRDTVTVLPPTASPPLARDADPRRCVFLGTGNALNVDGISWFLSDVWPRVIARLPDARLELIGSVCGAVAADVPSAIKHYTVAELSPLLARMSFAVNPLRGGSGLKIKMLDYFAHGVPAISTSVGAAGFPRNGEEPFVVCDEAVDFAETVIAWLGAPEIPARYSARCAGYARLFSRESSFAEIDRALGVSHRAGSDPDCGGGPP